ncbi:hypothetical protein [Synechococcus sp. BIOS-E4-1]|uniref:hypothetical protein n=1 Tax=Synechococcus sp. BIOS-E4-1 TaxID=1400864 RepID=UPI001644C2CF|nr:hypothetical protein [Synechococcus sp. BIOS-E4-1]
MASAQSIGTEMTDGKRQPYRAPACSLRAIDYDESQMKESDGTRREQQSELIYDC